MYNSLASDCKTFINVTLSIFDQIVNYCDDKPLIEYKSIDKVRNVGSFI